MYIISKTKLRNYLSLYSSEFVRKQIRLSRSANADTGIQYTTNRDLSEYCVA